MRYNIVLMAGSGQRFKNNNYHLPKPLLPINGELMFQKIIRNFPDCDEWIFTVNKEISDHNLFKNFISSFKEKHQIIILKKITDGQATSCLKSLEHLKDDDSVFVGSCDAMFQDRILNNEITNSEAVVFTIKPTRAQIINPESYGWVKDLNFTQEIYCKEKVEYKKNMNVILGHFYFKKVLLFKLGYKYIRDNGIYVNNELYIDVLMKYLLLQGTAVDERIVNAIVVGTPKEYEDFLSNEG